MTSNSFDDQLTEEIRRRVDAIEAPGYDFGERFGPTSWLAAAALIAICLLTIFLV